MYWPGLNQGSKASHVTAQKMKLSIKDFFSKCDQICSFLRIWSHLLKKSLMENFIFYAVCDKLFRPFKVYLMRNGRLEKV